MVDAFSPVLRSPKNAHLKNFFLIVPAMSINYIDYFMTAKENIPKKYREGTAFTDDGFAIGLDLNLYNLGIFIVLLKAS